MSICMSICVSICVRVYALKDGTVTPKSVPPKTGLGDHFWWGTDVFITVQSVAEEATES